MKKDLESYKKHDQHHINHSKDIASVLGIIKKYDEDNIFEKMGFKKAIETTDELPNIHIDIGSGMGWLLIKTSKYFEKIIGIEPSKSAIDTAKK